MRLKYVLPLLLLPTVAFGQGQFGNWKFGMTKEQVQKVQDCKPYTLVKVTQGLECRNYEFLGKKINISFIFRPNLNKIQLWIYEGKDKKEAVARLHALLKHLGDKYGTVESPQLTNPEKLTEQQLTAEVDKLTKGKKVGKLQFKPAKNPKDAFTFGSFFSHPVHGFYVFLYFQPPRKVASQPAP